MKILLLTSLFPNSINQTNGIFNLSRAQALQKIGCEVKVIAPIGLTPREIDLFPWPKFKSIYSEFKKNNSIKKHIVFENVIVYHPKWAWLPRRFFWKEEVDFFHFFAGKKIKKIILDFQPDLIITSWIHPFGTYSKYLEKYYDKTILSITEGSDLLIMPEQYRGWKKIEKIFNYTNSKLTFVSHNQKNIIEEKLKLKKGIVIQNGFNIENFWYSQKEEEIKKDRIRLISIGNLYVVKGYDILLQALIILGKKYSLAIIGAGDQKKNYLEFIEINQLGDQVTFLGKLPNNQIKKYLDQSDIYCQPSRSEGLPSAPLEAMGCGLPVVASRVGGLPEIIIDDFNGYLFENENVQDLVAKIEFATTKKWNQQEIASWSKNNFSWDKWANEIINIQN